MKRIRPIMLTLILTLLFLAACTTSSFQQTVDSDARVAQYVKLFPEAEYSETTFREAQLNAITDLISQDCGDMELPAKLIRATYTAKAATLAAYLDDKGEILCVASKLNQDAFKIEKGDSTTVPEGVLLTVNGEEITSDQLQAAYNSIPEAQRNKSDAGVLLNQMVDQRLLRQASADIVVDSAELDTAVENGWKNAGFESEDALIAHFDEQGGSIETYRSQVEQGLKVQKLLDDAGVTQVNVSDEAARNFYLKNTNAFLVSEQVQFRQLFISFEASDSRENAQSRLQNALKAINDGLDFCAAIQRYSDDTTSKDRCGEYVAARGVLSPNLEAAIFSLDVNQSTVTESQAGFHVILVIGKQPSMVIPYQQAADRVVGILKNQVVQQNLNIYLLKLRAEADIIDYS